VAKAPGTALTQVEFINDSEVDLHDWYDHHLGESRAWFKYEFFGASIPAGNKQLPLIV
jgi:hypothetical protein